MRRKILDHFGFEGMRHFRHSHAPFKNIDYRILGATWNGSEKCKHFLPNKLCQTPTQAASHIHFVTRVSTESVVLCTQQGQVFPPSKNWYEGSSDTVRNAANHHNLPHWNRIHSTFIKIRIHDSPRSFYIPKLVPSPGARIPLHCKECLKEFLLFL